MKKNIHPKYKNLNIKVGKDVFVTGSTYPGAEFLMDVDFRQHPAWTKKGMSAANQANKNVSDFNRKFDGLSFGVKK